MKIIRYMLLAFIICLIPINTMALTLNNNEKTYKVELIDREGSFGEGGSGSFGGDADPIDPDAPEVIENFCSETVLGAFTTIGWVFYIAKIVVPIVIIIFGCIDLGKAVISSKDDEIKKSVKTLAMRAIAGVIIFFIPTVLTFIVWLIDNDDTVGDFADCTNCMLDPTGSKCRSLGGY